MNSGSPKDKPKSDSSVKQSIWERSRLRKAIRRCAFVAEEGGKELLKWAGPVLGISALAGLWYLDASSGDPIDTLAVDSNDDGSYQ